MLIEQYSNIFQYVGHYLYNTNLFSAIFVYFSVSLSWLHTGFLGIHTVLPTQERHAGHYGIGLIGPLIKQTIHTPTFIAGEVVWLFFLFFFFLSCTVSKPGICLDTVTHYHRPLTLSEQLLQKMILSWLRCLLSYPSNLMLMGQPKVVPTSTVSAK